MNPRIQELLATFRRSALRYRSWLLLGIATVGALFIASAVRLDSVRRAAEGERRRAELTREIEAAKAWLAQYQAPTPAESAAWRRSSAEVAALSESNADRLVAARLVAERAQAAGIRVIRVNFLSPDTLEEAVPPGVEAAAASPPDWVLLLEADAGLPELARFLDTLPLGLALWRLEVIREGSRGRASLRLLRYTPSEGFAEAAQEPPKEGSR